MTLKELIKNNDFDYISIRLTPPPRFYPDLDLNAISPPELLPISEFMGCAYSKNGNLYPLDGDVYDVDEEVLYYERWSSKEENVQNGVSVVLQGYWISGADLS